MMADLLANSERVPSERPRSVDEGIASPSIPWTGSATSEVTYWRDRATVAEAVEGSMNNVERHVLGCPTCARAGHIDPQCEAGVEARRRLDRARVRAAAQRRQAVGKRALDLVTVAPERQGERTDKATSGIECPKSNAPAARTEKQLRAILRAPEGVQRPGGSR